jgi:hypothetical protein
MAEFLQTLPMTHAAHVARRSAGTQLQFEIYGWGLPIAKGAAQTIKARHLSWHAASMWASQQASSQAFCVVHIAAVLTCVHF